MKLQANYSGAWRNVELPAAASVDASKPRDEQLKALSDRLCPNARGRRIVDGDAGSVIWTWSLETGWRRPHWYGRGE